MRALLAVDLPVSTAEVAELVDALASGASGGNPVEVQVLSWAPTFSFILTRKVGEQIGIHYEAK